MSSLNERDMYEKCMKEMEKDHLEQKKLFLDLKEMDPKHVRMCSGKKLQIKKLLLPSTIYTSFIL